MAQAVRSGMQNIAEGSRASRLRARQNCGSSSAHASLDELLLGYENFLRQRRLKQWGKDDPEARQVRLVRTLAKEPKPGLNFGDVRVTRTENNVRSVTLCELPR
jgi:hypothetical protein